MKSTIHSAFGVRHSILTVCGTALLAASLLLLTGDTTCAGVLQFNSATAAHVQVGSRTNLDLTGTNLTLEAWIKPTGPGSDASLGGVILGREGEYMVTRSANGYLQYNFATPGHPFAAIFIDTGRPAPSNVWTHVALTYDGGIFRFYTNGFEVDSFITSGPIGDTFATEDDFRIGGRQHQSQYFQGQIDEVRVWNVTRSVSNILASMNRPLQGNETGLVAYYRFDEGFGLTTADATGRGLTGTLTGGPIWDPASDALAVPVPITRPAGMVTESTVQLNASLSTNAIATSNSFWLATTSSTALSFNGISNSVSFSVGPSTVYNVHPLTVTAWIKTDVPGGGGLIVNKYVGGSLNGWQLFLVNGQIRAWYFRDASNYVWDGANGLNGGNVDDGQWHYVAFTVGPLEGRLYVDGLLQATNGWRGAAGACSTAQPLSFGTNFAGQLDDVTVWKVDLNAAAISQLMTSPPTSAHPQYANLVGYWPLDEGTGQLAGEAWRRTPAGLLVAGPHWVPQARPLQYFATPLARVSGTNAVLDLDGLDDYVRVPAGIWFSNEFTIEALVYERSYNNHSRLIDFGTGVNGQSENVLFALSAGTTGKPYFSVLRGAASAGSIVAPDPIPLDQWVHLAATVKTNLATVYVNGVAVVSGTLTGPPNAINRTNNFIGRSNWVPPLGSDGYANALFDDVRLWKVARTAAEIRQFMTAPVSPADANLLLNYRFDEPSGVTVVDYRSTSPPQNGILTNGASRLPFERPSVDLVGLAPATRYHFRSAAASTNGTELGLVESFATPTKAAGTALDFDGTNDFARVAGIGNSMPTTNVTVEFWQRVHAPKVQSTFALEPDNNASRFQAHVPFVDGIVYWDFGNISGNAGRLSYTPPQSIVGTWQHFAFVASVPGNYMRIYRNGILEMSKVGASTFTRGTYDLTLGRNTSAVNFGGELDEFRIWNVARDGTNILQDFNRRLQGNEPGLLVYYRMDEGASSVLLDATGRGRDGLLPGTNSPTWIPSTAPAGWPIVRTSEVTDIVLGDVTLHGTLKGDASSDTRVWIEYGQYVPVPNSAENYFYGYTNPPNITSVTQVNFNGPPNYIGTFTNIALGPTYFSPPEWPGGPVEFAARYLGRIFLPATGNYTFYCGSDDGSQLYLDGQLSITNDGLHGYFERGVSTNLTAGYHWLDARMFDRIDVAMLFVSYAGPGIPKQVIPPTAFLRHEAVFTSRTMPQTYAAATGFQDFSGMATNVGASSTSYVFRVVVANSNGTNYGPEQSVLMGSPGAFTGLFFNGIGANVLVPDGTNFLAFPGTDEFTIEAWVNPVSLGATQTVVSKFNHPTQREYFLALDGQGHVVFDRQGSDFASIGRATNGQYTHVAATFDGVTRRIYINGQLDPAVDSGSGPITNSGAPFLIGARYWSSLLADFFQGVIDDVRVWQIPRSQAQIAGDMNRRLSGYELGLVAYYRFDEAQGGFAYDYTIDGYTGLLRSGAVYVPSGPQFACTSAPPALNIDLLDFDEGVIIWWPITCNEYVLEEAETPDAPPQGWSPVLEPVTPIEDSYVVVFLLDRYNNGFFRLRRL